MWHVEQQTLEQHDFKVKVGDDYRCSSCVRVTERRADVAPYSWPAAGRRSGKQISDRAFSSNWRGMIIRSEISASNRLLAEM